MTEIDSDVYTGRSAQPASTTQAVGAAASDAASTAKDTAKEQAGQVVGEVKTQTRNLVNDARDRVGGEMRSQNDRLTEQIRRFADDLDQMRHDRGDSPAGNVVAEVAQGGRRLADYLSEHGPDGVLREVEDFARRRPGAFLATALAAGFVVGRLGKSVAKADGDAGKPDTDSFVSPSRATYAGTPATDRLTADDTIGYTTPATTEYAATGTGTPAVVEETYLPGTTERRS